VKRLPLRVVLGATLLAALLLAGVVSFYASSSPDGLSRVAEDKGITKVEKPHATDGSPLAGYEVAGVDHTRLSKGVAGVAGVLVVLALGTGLSYAVRRSAGSREREDAHAGART
jgi:hypothetical protein